MGILGEEASCCFCLLTGWVRDRLTDTCIAAALGGSIQYQVISISYQLYQMTMRTKYHTILRQSHMYNLLRIRFTRPHYKRAHVHHWWETG